MKLKLLKKITVYIMSILYISVGVKHFTNPDFFLAIVPPFLLFKIEIVYLSGIAEILLGLCLIFKKTRKIAAIGILILLILVFPANIYLYISDLPQEILNISKDQAMIRMPFQIPLIILALWHSQEKSSKIFSTFCIIIFIPTLIYFLTI